jgi:glycosyltransferase involved in cell wall biosynthesis
MKSNVTVLIPVRGQCDFIGETLISIRDSLVQPDELLIIDDGLSSHGIWNIDKNSFGLPIRILNNSGRGLVDALNTGLNSITSKYVCRIDSDDVMHDQRIGSQLDRFKFNLNLVAVGSQCIYIDSESKIAGRSHYATGIINQLPTFKTNCLLAHPSTMYLREAALQVGGYRSLFTWNDTDIAEDFDFWLRLSTIGELEVIDENLTFYRQHKGQISSKFQIAQLVGTPYVSGVNMLLNSNPKSISFPLKSSIEFRTYLATIYKSHGISKLFKIVRSVILRKIKSLKGQEK